VSPPSSLLQQASGLADHMEALAIELRSISDDTMQVIPTEATLVLVAKRIYNARRGVDKLFDMAGFAVSPAWDIMLDLYQARASGQKVSVSSATIGGACPPTTGLRWLQVLEDRQLIVRLPDETDGRRIIVELTDCAIIKIAKALEKYY
jgi:hypothetical protein